jgi:hypothetical protein
MRRRTFITLLGGAAAWPVAARAQQAAMPMIGYLNSTSPGDQGLRAAKEASDTIPIVVSACDPLDSLVASIARPGGKATGLTCISSDLASKRLQMLKELVPALSRVAIQSGGPQ